MSSRQPSLPPDILAEIIRRLELCDIVNCSAVSRTLHSIVRNDFRVLYKIELGVSGLVPTGRMDEKVALCDRLKRLQECTSRMAPDPTSPTKGCMSSQAEDKKIDLVGSASCSALVGGMLTRYIPPSAAQYNPDGIPRVEVTNFYSDPEFNNMQSFSWDTMTRFNFIATDPSQDIFFGFSDVYGARELRVTILQLSTGDPYLGALGNSFELPLECIRLNFLPKDEVQVVEHIFGLYLGHVTITGGTMFHHHGDLYIVDWTKGIVTHVVPGLIGTPRWHLASKDTLLVTGHASESRPYSSLDVYFLQDTLSGKAILAATIPVATFLFPKLTLQPEGQRRAPIILPSRSPSKSPASLYADNVNDFIQEDRPHVPLIAIQHGGPHASFVFITPVSTFVNIETYLGLDRVRGSKGRITTPATILWESWGPAHTRCLEFRGPNIYNIPNDVLIDGFHARSQLHGAMDFNPLRVRKHLSRLLHTPQSEDSEASLVSGPRTVPGEGVFVNHVTTELAYAGGPVVKTQNDLEVPRGPTFWHSRQYHQGAVFAFYMSSRNRRSRDHMLIRPIDPLIPVGRSF